MFNSYNYSSNQNIKINAISGTLVKNYADSFFLDYDLHSEYAKMLHSKNPEFYKRESAYNKEPVVVLQTMVVGENRVISEIIYKKDFDKIFEEVDSENKGV